MFDLGRFLDACRTALREPSPELAMKAVLERAVSEPAEVERVLGEPRQGEIVTLHHSPELTVLKVLWAPGMAIYPHDHRMWAVIGLYGGREDNTFYRRTAHGLAVVGGKQLERSDVTVLGRHVIHAVANPSRRVTGAIHIYGGDFFGTPRSEWDPETLEERPYDVERARRLFAEANVRWAAESQAAG
jgi:predicted metal-dependent enzyme (double-stranded beta helix superfamily)